MIIVEGADGCGKTTLCNQLQRDFDLGIERPQRGGEMPIVPVRNRVYRALSKAIKGHQPAKIYDRLYLSELVYGRMLRDKVEFSAFEQLYINDLLKALRCPVIICKVDFDVAHDNLAKQPQLWGVEENYRKIYHAYEQYHVVNPGATHYDYTEPNGYKKVSDEIAEYLQERTLREW